MEYEARLHFENKPLFERICGITDHRLPKLEKMLGVRLVPRGHSFRIFADNPKNLDQAEHFFANLQDLYPPGSSRLPEDFDLQYLFRSSHKQGSNVEEASEETSLKKDSEKKGENKKFQGKQASLKSKNPLAMSKRHSSKHKESSMPGQDHTMDYQKQVLLSTPHGRKVFARTKNQAKFVESVLKNEITLCIGPAGTGKTFLATAAACRMLQKGEVERIVLTRPAVEAGESLGYLPGDLTQKVDPYLRPLFDALYECLGPEKVSDLIELKRIEVAPLAFMRGRTLNDSFVILDEAQNCTLGQLKMFLTRLGRNSRMCIGGDVTQIDLPGGKSGFVETARLLDSLEGVGIIRFGHEDIIRNPLVERIVHAFEQSEGAQS